MATSGLLALLDDMATIMDDVAAMSKIAAKKTAGIAGDDLAVNAQVMVGIDPKRELPIVGTVMAGSFANKAVLIPLALVLPSYVVTPLLMAGGAFLCYEAAHKTLHKKDAKDEYHHQKMLEAITSEPDGLKKLEKQKIRQAIGTDAILSAEIIAIALSAVATAPLITKATVLTLVGIGMTVGVYGLVALIVKLDDIGLHLMAAKGVEKRARVSRAVGQGLVRHTPAFMKLLSIAGTAAMFLVGGGIILHGIPVLHHMTENIVATLPIPFMSTIMTLLFGGIIGVLSMPLFQAIGAGTGKIVEKLRASRAKQK